MGSFPCTDMMSKYLQKKRHVTLKQFVSLYVRKNVSQLYPVIKFSGITFSWKTAVGTRRDSTRNCLKTSMFNVF